MSSIGNSINDPALSPYLPLAGGTMSGAINMGTNQIHAVVDPTSAQDAATKNYVDNIALGGAEPCYCATTASLNATYSNGVAGVGATLTDASGTFAAFTVDGQSPSVGTSGINTRVLVKNQSTTYQNGIYNLTTNGNGSSISWILTRAVDYDTPTNINDVGLVPVVNGTVNASSAWYNTTTMVAVGTTAVTFVKFSQSGAINKITQQIFTSSTTYTPTTGMVYCIIEVVGGGGGSGGAAAGASGTAAGEGGAGGGYSKGVFSAATIGSSQTVTIGAGGSGGSNTGGNGTAGGTTSVGLLIQATGGGYGEGGSNQTSGITFVVGGNSIGGVGSGGSLNVNGNPGGAGIAYGAANATGIGGYGGASVYGGGGAISNSGAGGNGTNYGGGASGALTGSTPRAGGTGAPGVVYITEFCSV